VADQRSSSNHEGFERPPSGGVPDLLQAAPVAIVAWDDEGRTRVWNRGAERIFGWLASEVIGNPCPVLADLLGEAAEGLRRQWASGVPIEDEEIEVRRADGTVVEVSVSAAKVKSESVAALVVAIDVSARRRRARRLHHLATHDPLTDLHNRRAFEHSLERVIERIQRGGPPGALLIVDVDGLKRVNDRLGHLAGDALLISVANALRAAVRPRDLLARVGGDEFAVALEEVTLAQVAQVAERIRTSTAALRIGAEGATRPTASIGGVVIDGTLDSAALTAAADDALYLAKQRRNHVELHLEPRVVSADGADEGKAVRCLRRALTLDALTAQYQGVHDLEDGTMHSEEALARIKLGAAHAGAGEFIGVAERTGLVAEVDRRVIRLVLDRLAGPPQQRLSMNLSAASLADPQVLELLRAAAPREGYEQRLILEARESDLQVRLRSESAWAEAATELGVVIAADDFGTSRSSFTALDSLPIGLAKLDRSVVASLASRSGHRRVRDLVAACRDRGTPVVAKGVEQPETLEQLRSLGIVLAQGFLLDEPHTAVSVCDLLEAVADLAPASLGLIAWEFTIPERAVAPVWRYALDNQLIRSAGVDPETQEPAYALTVEGGARLRRLRERGDGPTDVPFKS
jgi:diguanylate cyclase (GGDEF)-like protein/PAS domain S-box-containing protein